MNEGINYSIDDICHLFNRIESKYDTNPLQSTVIANQLLPLKHHDIHIEEQIINLCAKNDSKTKYKLPNRIVDEYKAKLESNENIPNRIFEKNIYSDIYNSTNDIDQGIELADDLLKSYSTYMRNMPPPVQVPVESNYISSSSTKHDNHDNLVTNSNSTNITNDQNSKNNHSITNTDRHGTSAIPEISKQMKFTSAKDKYLAEGGKIKQPQDNPSNTGIKRALSATHNNSNSGKQTKTTGGEDRKLPPELENYDKELVDKIEADIINQGQIVTFSDIAGLEFAKKCVTELICWPMTRPDLFKGLRSLPRGVLLFGPPGTGKTLIGKAIAHQSGATFFSISASSLMSKWIGEGEKTVRTLFAVAAYRQPSVVFLDEVDSLLCQRSADENEASRRMKTEFMVQLDGATTNLEARVVIVGATNRPEELDEAVRRRFIKRIYIPLPDAISRECLLRTLLKDVKHSLNERDCLELITKTDGFSGADIRSLCTEAAMGPVREAAIESKGNLSSIDESLVPPISMNHFKDAFDGVVASVSPKDLDRYIIWNNSFGSFRNLM